ncbi:MAG: GNAT family N-acetyltransferase [Pirellulaceae bacterium]
MAEDSWRIEPFDKQRHDRTGFNCGVESLNGWLHTKITQYEKRGLAKAYVLVGEEGEFSVKGYYALSNHSVVFDALPADQAKGLPRSDVPVVLIGRLAVDTTLQGKGCGEFLLIDALRRCQLLATEIGIRAVEVDAIDQRSKDFYLKYGFVSLLDDDRHLFLPMQNIRKLKLLE